MRHDDPDTFEIAGPPELPAPPEDVIRVLEPMITARRVERIRAVAEARTLGVLPVLDGLSDPHNASAILRSSEAFGVQRVDIVRGPYGFRAAKSVDMGSSRWLDLHLHPSSEAAAQTIQADGYAIYVAVMDGDETPHSLADRVAQGERVAVVFGNERHGVSDAMRTHATGTYRIPMRGFVESLNVSVAAASTLYTVCAAAPPISDPSAVQRIVARYMMHSVKDAEMVLREKLGLATE